MKTIAEIAKRLRELAWGISTIGEAAEMEEMAKQLESLSVTLVAHADGEKEIWMPINIPFRDIEIDGDTGIVVVEEFLTLKGAGTSLEEQEAIIARYREGASDDDE